MTEQRRSTWPGRGLMSAGTIVFVVGVVIILFKEFNIPRYWLVAVIGLILMGAGLVVGRMRRS